MPAYTKTFYIAVAPVISKFAKGLQKQLRDAVTNKVLRTMPNNVWQGRSFFPVTQTPLNKIEQLQRFTNANVPCPRWTTNKDAVANWGVPVVFARTLVNATNGRGIVEIDLGNEGPIVPAPLYTEYIKKKSEYRVHVFNGEVIDVQHKKKRRGFESVRNSRIRNLHNGYIYCRDGIDVPAEISTLAINAVNSLDYLYGAVDIIYNDKRKEFYVLEVNSRPGLMGTTVEKYAEAIVKTYNLERK